MVKFGVFLPFSGPKTSPTLLKKVAMKAEEFGFNEVYVNDQITSYQYAMSFVNDETKLREAAANRRIDTFESLTTLAYAASITEKVQLGVHVLVPPRRHPVTVAKQVANVDNLSGGRLWLGVGIGSVETSRHDYEKTYKVGFEERGAVVDEYIEAFRVLWSDLKASYHGKYVHFEDVLLYPKPVQKPLPMWIASRTSAALRRVAKYGDGWTLTREFPEYISKGRDVLRKYLDEIGRKVDIPVCFQADTCIAKNEDDLKRWSEEGVQRVRAQGHETYNKRSIDSSLEAVLRRSFMGTPDQISRQVQRYLDAGVNRFKLMFMWKEETDFLKQIELFAKEVLPSYR